MGRTSTYQSTITLPWVPTSTSLEQEEHTNTWPERLQATSSIALNNGEITNSVTLPDGASDSRTLGPDPVWGLQAPVDTSETLTTRDAEGRVTAKAENINGVTNLYSYTYDLAGRLITAAKNGAADKYTYDSNSNRLSATTSSGTSNGTYDAQDRLLSYGNASYSYTANGEITKQIVGLQETSYTYDVLGDLTSVTLPNGAKITYIIDPENRRIGKQLNGVLESGLLYDGDAIVAQMNGNNQLVSQFVYATGPMLPDYMISGGTTYRIFSDQLGSPVLVVNAATGAIIEQITYDEFGNVLGDTHPGFQPFGFAGGLYDQDTKLINFGARDYTPSTGRWTAKDLSLFDGGDTNLYSYVLADPVNFEDPDGGDPQTLTQYGNVSGAAQLGQQLGESVHVIKKIHKGYKKCKKVVNAARKISQGVDGVKQLAVDEATGYVKSTLGPQNEQRQLHEQDQPNASAAQGFANPVSNLFGTSADSLAGKSQPCPKCKDQPKPPSPRTPKQWQEPVKSWNDIEVY